MRLGGWLRLWVVVAVLWAAAVALFAYETRPQLDTIKSAWVYQATEKIAEKISGREGRTVGGFEVRDGVKERYPTDDDVIRWLKHIEASPKPHQEIFSA